MRFLLVIAAILALSCSTNTSLDTTTSMSSSEERFQDKIHENKTLRQAIFIGSEGTSSKKAQVFSKFRAVKVCNKHGQFPVIIRTVDLSQIKITKTSQRVIRYNNDVPADSKTNKGKETKLVTPKFSTYFTCNEKLKISAIYFKDLSSRKIGNPLGDNKGGLKILGFPSYSNNKNSLNTGDILLKIDGKRIIYSDDFKDLVKNKDTVIALLLRGSKLIKKKMLITDYTERFKKIKIDILKQACKYKELSQKAICKPNKQ